MARRNATSQRPVRPTSQPAPRKGLPLSPHIKTDQPWEASFLSIDANVPLRRPFKAP